MPKIKIYNMLEDGGYDVGEGWETLKEAAEEWWCDKLKEIEEIRQKSKIAIEEEYNRYKERYEYLIKEIKEEK